MTGIVKGCQRTDAAGKNCEKYPAFFFRLHYDSEQIRYRYDERFRILDG